MGERGFGLLEVLMAAVILGTLALGFAEMLSRSMASVKSVELRDEVTHIRKVVSDRMDCAQTMLSQTCSASWVIGGTPNSPYFPLKTKTGSLGEAFGSTDVKIGNWVLRASCVDNTTAGLKGLFVQYSRPRSIAGADFYSDPLTGRTADWAPLFPANEPLICTNPLPAGPIQVDAPLSTSGNNAGQTCENIVNTLVGCVLSLGTGCPRIATARVQCPAGKQAISGGVQCGAGWSLLAGTPEGMVLSSRPSDDGTAWEASCCVQGGNATGTKAYVKCM